MKTFNTAGPIQPDDHYNIPALSRWNMDEIRRLIQEKRYFVLHAPRQTGKTTCLLALMAKLNEEGNYTALYVNVEPAQTARENVRVGITTVISRITRAARRYLDERRLRDWAEEILGEFDSHDALQELLSRWSEENHRPIVLLLDEVDALVGDTLISLLRQIRAGYPDRPGAFPQTVLLCGVRDVRDYRIQVSDDRGDNQVITGGSAFNIKSKSLRLGNFSREDVATLYAQHTEESAQVFEAGVIDYVFEQTAGQPWLVNALGDEVCFEMKAGRDRTRPITLEVMMEARERLIERRDTHIDQLADKLKEPRVHRVISELLSDDAQLAMDSPSEDDQLYVQDLGLIRTRPQIAIANPIYREVIPRTLTWIAQTRIPQESAWYVKEDGQLDIPKLLDAFQQFFRENSEIWIEKFDYKEAGPQLLMQSFLQRIVNGGGRIGREYGLGRRRTDLLIEWPLDENRGFHGPVQRAVIELKILCKSLEATLEDGLAQTAGYRDRASAEEGYLVIFDRAPKKSWEEKCFVRQEQYGEYRIGVWGM
ncbi:MAG: AAA ATPase domain-containing protein [Candidatus Kentron sp. G]|nr:MAG: AAA ATPase domain-containing protein [Candidatus Kentron sp. G]VFM99186.1 MAG: AAA ATPase domain-containing protein [Candidatus Kentron sp. G]VFM99847.1 MAG: AAA ATPase domain-containing protein [Candidatus Kentron sp. G]